MGFVRENFDVRLAHRVLNWVLWVAVFTVLVVMAKSCNPEPAYACDLYLTHKGEPVYSKPLGETGLTVYGWSMSGGDKADFETVWQDDGIGEGAKHMPWPLFYGYNLDANGRPTLVLIDTGGHGKCEDIKTHWKQMVDPKRQASK